ncbi:MAG: DUF2950 domain-containing protein [Verrucomicrobiales bacterium]|nr:DUF2950 domain-containing protein [Verrucomicrobiales bacterium]
MNRIFSPRPALALIAGALISTAPATAADLPRTFASPEDAVAALRDAVTRSDTASITAIFGTEGSYLINPDPVMAASELNRFSQALSQGYQIVPTGPDRRELDAGTNGWPFPVPIVESSGTWRFDAAAGREEILNRRIGADELKVLESLRAFVAAQREYALSDRDGNDILEYAGKFISAPGRKDGLYWPPELDGTESPMGPLVAAAQQEGYSPRSSESATARPFHGYYFKILTRQGRHAPAGAYDYRINGHLIGGFAAVAWPAEYGETGVMTFIVNQQGRVYQKDLGPKTASIASRMKEYDPGTGWVVSPD